MDGEPQPTEEINPSPPSSFGVPQAIFGGLAVIAVSIYLSFGIPNSKSPLPNPPHQGEGISAASSPQSGGGEVGGVRVEMTADDDPTLGRAGAPVTVIEFSDFQCPFCRRFWAETFPELKQKYIDTGRVRFVYRDFPLPMHPSAEVSAIAAECAADQGRFWEMHDKIFSEQSVQGTGTIQYEEEDIIKWAGEIGLNSSRFTSCLESEEQKAEVLADARDGAAAGVSGTPTFFINGQKLEGAQPFDSFQKIIEAELLK